MIVLNIIKIVTNQMIIKHAGEHVECHEDGEGWCFNKCAFTTPVFITHVLTTMQTAGIVRAVFIKTTKKAQKSATEATMEDLKSNLASVMRITA